MEVRPATREQLGAVIIGEGFDITEDGILTVDTNSIEHEDYVEFTRERLEHLFRVSKARRR